jgi:transaldolase
MRLFIDTARVEEIREVASWGVLSGVTTNPSLARQALKPGQSLQAVFQDMVREICYVVEGPVSAEVLAEDAEGMVEEGRSLAAIAPNVIIKLPLTAAGLEACAALTAEDIETNLTLVFSVNQALLAAAAGATYVSPFVGRLDDIGEEGMALVRDIVEVFQIHGIDTQVIAASIRNPQHVVQAALSGSHVSTIPFAVFKQMLGHPLTAAGIQKFAADWRSGA